VVNPGRATGHTAPELMGKTGLAVLTVGEPTAPLDSWCLHIQGIKPVSRPVEGPHRQRALFSRGLTTRTVVPAAPLHGWERGGVPSPTRAPLCALAAQDLDSTISNLFPSRSLNSNMGGTPGHRSKSPTSMPRCRMAACSACASGTRNRIPVSAPCQVS
jgi:hypothetical protein